MEKVFPLNKDSFGYIQQLIVGMEPGQREG
jgi:hypothetical protein